MSQIDYALYAYILSFLVFIDLLCPKTRHCLRNKQWYKKYLNLLVLIRQTLLFLFPLWVAILAIGPNLALNQLPTLVALGLSIIVFWVVELPLLMQADIFVTFGVDDGNYIAEADCIDKIVLDAD